MKIKTIEGAVMIVRKQTTFHPITIILQSQEETDKLFAALNYSCVYDGLEIGSTPADFGHLYKVLQATKPDYIKWHRRIENKD